MAERSLIDTDVLIEYLRGREKAIEYLEGLEADLSTSVISVAELFAGSQEETKRSTTYSNFFWLFLYCPPPKG